MTLLQAIDLGSGVLLISGCAPCIYETIKQKTAPNRMSRFIWPLATTVLFAAAPSF